MNIKFKSEESNNYRVSEKRERRVIFVSRKEKERENKPKRGLEKTTH